MANELVTVEIDSKNYDKLIDLLNESNLIVEILQRSKQTVVRTTSPIDVVCLTHPYISEAEKLSTASCSPDPFNYSISTTV